MSSADPIKASGQAPFSPYQLSLDFSNEHKFSSNVQRVIHSLPHNPVLQSLDLSVTGSVQLSVELLQRINTALLTNTTLNTLYLSGNLTRKKIGFSTSLSTNSTLTALYLDNCLFPDAARDLGKALKTNSGLRTLSLRGCCLDISRLKDIAHAVINSDTITELNLSGTLLGGSIPSEFTNAIKTSSSLTILDLSGNLFDTDDALRLAEVLAVNSTLTVLDLGNTGLDEEGANQIFQALQINSHLTTMHFSSTIVPSAGTLMTITEVLIRNTTLTSLDLSGFKVRPEGALLFSKALATNTSLLELNLADSEIDSDGISALAGSLSTNNILTCLNLAGNPIKSSGFTMITSLIRTSTALTSLSFSAYNSPLDLTQENWSDFFTAIGESISLETLQLDDASDREIITPLISAAIQCNTVLKNLLLNETFLSGPQVGTIIEAFAANGSLTQLRTNSTRSPYAEFEGRNQRIRLLKEVSLFSLILTNFTEALYADEIAASLSMDAQSSSVGSSQ